MYKNTFMLYYVFTNYKHIAIIRIDDTINQTGGTYGKESF